MVETKAVSVRLPLDLLNELNSYATDKGMVRSGDANIGGAIIAILRERFFGQSDNVVKQVSDNVDIEAMIANLRGSIDAELREIKHDISGLRCERMSEATTQLVIENLQQRIEALEVTAPANFTSALMQKAKVLAHQKTKELPQAM